MKVNMKKAIEWYLDRDEVEEDYCQSISGRGFETDDPKLLKAIRTLDVNYEFRGDDFIMDGFNPEIERWFTKLDIPEDETCEVEFYGFEGSEKFLRETEVFFGVDLSYFKKFKFLPHYSGVYSPKKKWALHYEGNDGAVWSPNGERWYAVEGKAILVNAILRSTLKGDPRNGRDIQVPVDLFVHKIAFGNYILQPTSDIIEKHGFEEVYYELLSDKKAEDHIKKLNEG
jgi:hypothetical protein